MNALLRIQVIVAAREAQNQLRQLQGTVSALNRTTSVMGRQTGGTQALAAGGKAANSELTALGRLAQRVNGAFDRTNMGMIQLGKNMQWVGRQINFNFTIPLILAGRSIMGWALDSERAFTRVRKVYGEFGQDYTEELVKIRQGLRMLSDYYGVTIDQVTELGAQWAAAGLAGAPLLEAIRTSINLSILGDYEDLSDVFKQLVVVMGAYNLKAGDLKLTVSQLNTVENMTAATLPDLVTAIARSGAAAHTAGVDIEHLTAMIAVLVPATGSASTAGNALRTVFSRLMAPTQDTVDILKEVGINYYDTSFQMLRGDQRLELIASKWETLTDAQRANLASIVASRWQFNRFNELMDDMSSKQGTYAKVLAALDQSLDQKNVNQATKEIQTLLKSDPRQIQILTTAIKNLLIDAIIPAIPVLISILSVVRGLFQWFGSLPAAVQKAAIGFLLLVAAVGIAAQMVGSFRLLFGTFLDFIIWAAQLIPGVALKTSAATVAMATTSNAAMASTTAAVVEGAATQAAAVTAATQAEVAAAATAQTEIVGILGVGQKGILAAIINPWTLAIAAIATLAIIFRRQIKDAILAGIDLIKKGFNSLPQSIQNALLNVARVVARIVKAIVHWLSYLNPFARHSPSLVDNVTAGVEAILRQYARLTGISSLFRKSADDLAAFTAATRDAVDASTQKDRAEQTQSILSVSPGAGPATAAMYSNLDALKAALPPLTAAMDQQQAKVDDLRREYDAASLAVDNFEASMKPLQALVDSLQEQIDASTEKIQEYASTNITGMKAASDAIFENEMAQKRLRLEMLRMDEAGQGFEDIRKQIAALNGDIESIQGEMTSLRQAGAGSDILGVYQDQLDSLYAQRDSLTQAQDNAQTLQDQLEALQRQGEILNLEESLNFDPLLRQIDDLANAQKEMSFDDIIKGITDEKAKVADLTQAYDTNKAVLDQQQASLDQMNAARDTLKITLDNEQATLDVLKDTYSQITDNINSIEEALNAAASAAANLTDALGGGGGGAGGGGAFGDLTGDFEDAIPTLDEFAGDLEKWLADMQAQFDGISLNPFGFIKRAWNNLKDWWTSTAGPWLADLGRTIWDYLQAQDYGPIDIGGILDWFSELPGKIGPYLSNVQSVLENFFDSIGSVISNVPYIDDFKNNIGEWATEIPGYLEGLWDTIQKTWAKLKPAFEKFGELGEPFMEAMGHMYNVARKTMNLIIDVVEVGLRVLLIVFTPALLALKLAWKGVWGFLRDVLGPAWDAIVGVFKSMLDMFRNTLKFFLDLINGDWGKAWDDLTAIFTAWWDGFYAVASNIVKMIYNVGADIIGGLWEGLKAAWDMVFGWFQQIWQWIIDYVKHIFGIQSPSSVFLQIGIDMITGLLNGIVEAFKAVARWFGDLFGVVTGYFVNGASWLVNAGWAIVNGLWGGITSAFGTVRSWLTGLASTFASYFLTAGTWLLDKGSQIASGIYNGLLEGIASVWTWLTGLPETIKAYFVKAKDWLFDIGKAIIQGLWDGMVNIWNKLTGWIGGLGGWIKDHKGPPAVDARLLTENGRLIMQGLRQGMQEGWQETAQWIQGLDLSNAFNTDALGRSAAMLGSSVAGSTTNTDSRTLTFNGDLSFPNITDPADAEKFISNLEALAGV